MSSKFRILIVDDEPDILDVICDVLTKIVDLEVVTAQNGEEAKKLLPTVDAVIADCLFPDCQLFERALAASGKPAIRMSGKIDRATNLELPKPFKSRQLINAVEMLRFFHSPDRESLRAG
jgi:DNA-binding response OmpR family regulator